MYKRIGLLSLLMVLLGCLAVTAQAQQIEPKTVVVGDGIGEVRDIYQALEQIKEGDTLKLNKDVVLTKANGSYDPLFVDKTMNIDGNGYTLEGQIAINASDIKVTIQNITMYSELIGESGVTSCIVVPSRIANTQLSLINSQMTVSNQTNYPSVIRIDGINTKTDIDGCTLTGAMGVYINNYGKVSDSTTNQNVLWVKGDTSIYTYQTNRYNDDGTINKDEVWGGVGINIDAHNAIVIVENGKIGTALQPDNNAPYYPVSKGITINGDYAMLTISGGTINTDKYEVNNEFYGGNGLEVIGKNALISYTGGSIAATDTGIYVEGNSTYVQIVEGNIVADNVGVSIKGDDNHIEVTSGYIEGINNYGIYAPGINAQVNVLEGQVKGYPSPIYLDEMAPPEEILNIQNVEQLVEVLGVERVVLSQTGEGIPQITLIQNAVIPSKNVTWELPQLIVDGNGYELQIEGEERNLFLYGTDITFKNLKACPNLYVLSDEMTLKAEQVHFNTTRDLNTPDWEGAIYIVGNECNLHVKDSIISGEGEKLYTGIRCDGRESSLIVEDSIIKGNIGIYVNNYGADINAHTAMHIEGSDISSICEEDTSFGGVGICYDGSNIYIEIVEDSHIRGTHKGIQINAPEGSKKSILVFPDCTVTPGPTLVYEGKTEFVLQNGQEFTLPEVKAIDDMNKALEVNIEMTLNGELVGGIVEGIDTTRAGNYKIIYTAVDEDQNQAEPLIITVVVKEEIKLAEGWNQTDKGWTYVQNGELLKGWSIVGGYVRYFDEVTGVLATGWVNVGGYNRYFTQDGVILAPGWQFIEGAYRYFGIYGTYAENCWYEVGGYLRYFGEQGKLATGFKEVFGIMRYFTEEDGVLLPNSWMPLKEGLMYLDENGSPAKGWYSVNGQPVRFFDSNGFVVLNGITPDGIQVDANGFKVIK